MRTHASDPLSGGRSRQGNGALPTRSTDMDSKRILGKLGMVVATAVVSVTVAGSGVASAFNVPMNSVNSAKIVNNSVRSIDIRDGGVRSVDVADHNLTTNDIANGSLTGGDIA